MDAPWLFVAGVVVLLVATVDQMATILGAGNGSGVLTPRIQKALWRGALAIHRRRSIDGGLVALGPALLLVGPALWISGLWLGWSLLFMADPQAVLDSTTREPVSLNGRIYFAGFSVSTLGVGDLVPGPGVWRLATVVAALTGLSIITLSITYLVPVVQAATDRRQAARSIGTTLDLASSSRLDEQSALTSLERLVDALDRVGEQHHTYHVLRYFRSPRSERSLPVQVSRALGLLERRNASDGSDSPLLEATLVNLARSIGESTARSSDVHEALRAVDARCGSERRAPDDRPPPDGIGSG